MLEFIQDVVDVEVLGKVRSNYMLKGFTEDTGQRDRTIVCRVTGVSFFIDRAYICLGPFTWDLTS
ncbi:hypothetical protein DPMN_035402 [Dreissena polymorpha]|uniref:Uncharacterized protein n=1 Tax=Dreissena polymorpha TaxID=45954 RepID=A0A9D4MAW4_DREPO|nr:hypothetical protein DPMN_035402 [Dreissena polymorpha]